MLEGFKVDIMYATHTSTRPRMAWALSVAAAPSGRATENATSEPLNGPFGHTCRARVVIASQVNLLASDSAALLQRSWEL